MARKEKRFIEVHKESEGFSTLKILVDSKTGVNYFFRSEGYSGGMCLLVDREGKPIVSAIGGGDLEL